jgi:group I intron endonuclease
MGCLYRLTFPSGKSYIGITRGDARSRFRVHCVDAKCGKTTSMVWKAIRKYGADSVKVETLVVCDKWDVLCELERRTIKLYATKAPHGYNMTDGGDGVVGFEITEEFRRKSGDSRRGKRNSQSHNDALRRANLGRNQSEETRAKLSRITKEAWRKGRFEGQSDRAKAQWQDPASREALLASRLGKRASEETRARMSAAQLARPRGPTGFKQSEETKARRLASFRATIDARHAARKEAA